MARRSHKNSPEHNEQVKVFGWKNNPNTLAEFPQVALLHAIPNGIPLYPHERTFFVMEGLTAGVPDINLPVPSLNYCGLWIEMKSPSGGELSDKQAAMLKLLRSYGNFVSVLRTGEEAIAVIMAYLREMDEVLKHYAWTGETDYGYKPRRRQKVSRRIPVFHSETAPDVQAPTFDLSDISFDL